MSEKKSQLDEVIPPEIRNDEFHRTLVHYCSLYQPQTILEIGSSSGEGSTTALLQAASSFQTRPRLFCMELSRVRFAQLKQRYATYDWIHPYNTTAVPLAKFPTAADIETFYRSNTTALNNYPVDQVIGWLQQDIDYVTRERCDEDGIEKIRSEHGIAYFDAVLIDGSEFTGKAELDSVYGADLIFLDDINGFKNLSNHRRLASDPNYTMLAENWQVRNGFSVFKRNTRPDPIHFMTIVLNGMPFVQAHIEVFTRLGLPWHWHIVEGVASLVHDTAWGVPNGAKVPPEFHQDGLSVDGTSAYLDKLKTQFPDNISVYRKPKGQFWDGKVEMVRAPVLPEKCLLWQLDSDELWTVDEIHRMHRAFECNPSRTAAFVHCDYFVGPTKYVSSMNTWATGPEDWLRVWRYAKGMQWAAHEPPVLVDAARRNVAYLSPFTRDECLAGGISFQHFSYVTEQQVAFKESYYGYNGAVAAWKTLQNAPTPLDPADYLPWAKRGATVSEWDPAKHNLGVKWLGTVAKQYTSMSVDGQTQFETELRSLFARIRPHSIIETGTYLGRGTSTLIWRAAKDLGLDVDFTTIEVNPEHHRLASEWFSANGMNVRAELGLSVPRSHLPTPEQIEEHFVRNQAYSGIYYDHDEAKRSVLYYAETNHNVREDLLRAAMARHNYRPDFVLLDSAGHMGFVEFEYLLSMIKGDSWIMLDDIYHCKHFHTLQQIKKDPRFTIAVESPEKFGFCIVRYRHTLPAEKAPEKVLVMRLDSLGDAVLSAGMLPHLRRLYPGSKLSVLCLDYVGDFYSGSPYVDDILTVNYDQLEHSAEYRAAIERDIKNLAFDVVLHPTYSRTDAADLIALGSCAPLIIGSTGNLDGISEVVRRKNNQGYTHLVQSAPDAMTELQRNTEFLRGIGVSCSELRPHVHVGAKEEVWALATLAELKIDPAKTIVLSAFSKWAVKDYPHFGAALGEFCRDTGFIVLAVGTEKDKAGTAKILDTLPTPSVNLCGRTTVQQVAALIKHVPLVVGSDTVAGHFACAVGTPNVVVLGGGHFGRFFPYSNLTTIVSLPMDCYQCSWNCKHAEPFCITKIDPKSVDAAIRKALGVPLVPAEPPMEVAVLDVDLVERQGDRKILQVGAKRPAGGEGSREDPAALLW